MRVRILGCSGGIGGNSLRTTSLLLDSDILIDCGTGVADLSITELAQIDHVFITHTHMDHIACLPLMMDTVGDLRERALTVHASAAVIETLRAHVFNWAVWPDFAQIPSAASPYLRYQELALGQTVQLGQRRITALPANHTVPAVGYQIDSGAASLAFSGDTGPCPALWAAINQIDNLRYVIVETAFCNAERRLAQLSLHLCPEMLEEELAQLHRAAEVFITHLKPSQIELIMREIRSGAHASPAQMLQGGQLFEF